MRKCDFCGEKKHIRTFSKKQLIEEIDLKLKTIKQFKYSEFKTLEDKHNFQRKTRICKECIAEKFPKLNQS